MNDRHRKHFHHQYVDEMVSIIDIKYSFTNRLSHFVDEPYTSYNIANVKGGYRLLIDSSIELCKIDLNNSNDLMLMSLPWSNSFTIDFKESNAEAFADAIVVSFR